MLERQRRIGEIVEHAFERIVEQRQPVLHARIAAALAHRFVQQIVWGGCTEFRHIAGAEAAEFQLVTGTRSSPRNCVSLRCVCASKLRMVSSASPKKSKRTGMSM